MESFQLEQYLSNGVDKIVKGIISASIKNPKASLFMMQYAGSSKRAREKRLQAENNGEHIPPFLIASITDQCNLHCKGCYARATHSCTDFCAGSTSKGLLSGEQWSDVFAQAEQLGIGFILLAGGEPFVRQDVIRAAGNYPNMMFPIFTNGTMITEEYMLLLDNNRNLIPILSIEGNQETTDTRRGKGVYERLMKTMESLHKKGILFGASVTVTRENVQQVLSKDFADELKHRGAKAAIYVEYVPMGETDGELAFDGQTRALFMEQLNALRKIEQELVLIAFPGDEKSSGGCLAAGRGFFHINAKGGAEPCPFSPYSDSNVVETSLKQVLKSPLFQKLQTSGTLTETHVGGCVLYEERAQVQSFMAGGKA